MPMEVLYTCGAFNYPGGLVPGGPGYIASNVTADDMSVKKWWKVPAFIERYVEQYIGLESYCPIALL